LRVGGVHRYAGIVHRPLGRTHSFQPDLAVTNEPLCRPSALVADAVCAVRLTDLHTLTHIHLAGASELVVDMSERILGYELRFGRSAETTRAFLSKQLAGMVREHVTGGAKGTDSELMMIAAGALIRLTGAPHLYVETTAAGAEVYGLYGSSQSVVQASAEGDVVDGLAVTTIAPNLAVPKAPVRPQPRRTKQAQGPGRRSARPVWTGPVPGCGRAGTAKLSA
jgi:hypothetical protein